MTFILATLLAAPPDIEWFHIKGSENETSINWKGWPELIKAGMAKAAKDKKPLLLLAGDWT